jgi:hypothetical protein
MKKHIAKIFSLLLVFTLVAVLPAMAQETDHGAHKAMKKAKTMADEAMDHGKMDHGMPAKASDGRNWIRKAHVKGHHFAYELIDMREKMKDMPGMTNTHHLMVYVKDGNGNNIGKAKVGFLVKAPGGTSQKVMCMGMGGGFGSDVNLGKPGTYTIKTKIAAGDVKLMDSFDYEMK